MTTTSDFSVSGSCRAMSSDDGKPSGGSPLCISRSSSSIRPLLPPSKVTTRASAIGHPPIRLRKTLRIAGGGRRQLASEPHALRRFAGPLPAAALQAQRPQRAPPAGDLARTLAELRPRAAAGDEPRDRTARLRPRRDALRPREQLRAAVRLGRGGLRPREQLRAAV